MVNPTGMACVYTDDDHSQVNVVLGDCLRDKGNGVYVNGRVNAAARASIDSLYYY